MRVFDEFQENMNTVHICGWNATGKGVLAKLLDGHPELAVMPFDDSLASAFAQIRDSQELSYSTNSDVFNLGRFNQAVAESWCRYHRIQSGHHGLPLRLAPSVENIQLRTFEGFDFYEFEEDWVSEVNTLESFDPYTIMLEIYHSFFSHWNLYPYNQEKTKYYVGFGGKDIDEIEYLIKNDAKVIFAYRDPRGIIASIGDKDIKEKDTIGYLNDGLIYSIRSYHNKMFEYLEKYPSNVHVVSFEDLITEHEPTIESVRDFLQINKDSIINEPTLCGEKLPNIEYIGKINDKWEDIMSEDERRIANLQLGKVTASNIRPNALRCYLHALLVVTSRSALERTKEKIITTGLYS